MPSLLMMMSFRSILEALVLGDFDGRYGEGV
jgi:hypothetical protein